LVMMSFHYPFTLTYNSIDKHHATFFQMVKICLIVDISLFPSDQSLQACLEKFSVEKLLLFEASCFYGLDIGNYMDHAELELRNNETRCNGAASLVAKKINLIGVHFVHLGVLVHLWTEPLI
jgi:hypothetical protein